MPIIVNLDVMMAKRKMSLNELSGKVDTTFPKKAHLRVKRCVLLFSAVNILAHSPQRTREQRSRRDYIDCPNVSRL